MAWPCQAAEHDADHGEADEGCDGSCVALEIAGQATVPADPCECALDDPSLGQDNEAMRIASLDDLQRPATSIGHDLLHLRPLVACIGEDALDERKQPARRAQHLAGTIAILHVGRVHDHAQQQAERIDQDMTLASRDRLARIVTLRVERRAAF